MTTDVPPREVGLSEGLGPLPEPGTRTDWHHDGYGRPAYTAEQMHAYAAQEVAAERERWRSAAHRAVTAGYDELPDALYALDELCGPNASLSGGCRPSA